MTDNSNDTDLDAWDEYVRPFQEPLKVWENNVSIYKSYATMFDEPPPPEPHRPCLVSFLAGRQSINSERNKG